VVCEACGLRRVLALTSPTSINTSRNTIGLRQLPSCNTRTGANSLAAIPASGGDGASSVAVLHDRVRYPYLVYPAC